MRNSVKFLSTALFVLNMSTQSKAAPIAIDTKDSKVGFRIMKFKIGAEVPGTFETFSGTFEVDEKTKLLKSAKGEIKAESITTDSGKRDKHLKSEDFFDVKNHALITFDLKSHTGTLAAGEVKGSLKMKGIPKEITLKAVVKNPDPKAYEIALTGVINRKDFNINWNDVLDKGGYVLANDVTLDLTIKAAKAK